MSAFGDALTRLMMARGVGVHELARASNYTAGHISNLRTGAKGASPQCAAELDDILGGGGELLAAAGLSEAEAGPHPGLPVHVAVPLLVADVDEVKPAEHLRRFRDMISDHDSLFGPRALMPVVRDHLALIRQLRQGRTGTDARDLLILQAQYAETLAWQHQDCSEFRSAQYWLDRALEWAHMAGDMQWAAFVLARKSQLAGDMHDPAAAVDLAEAAARLASGDRTRLRAASAAYEAHGHALAGNADACQRSLDEASQIAARPDEAPDAPWATWLTPAYVEVARARCLDALGEHEVAAGLFGQAIDGIPATLRRERGVHLARQAVARADAGDPDGAGEVGVRAARIADLTGSGRIITELRRLDRTLGRRWPSHPAADEVRHALGSLVVPRQSRARRG
jgi:tetratricopeptide (TPR) repeat protein